MIDILLEDHDNIIYLCSHEEWLAFILSKGEKATVKTYGECVANTKFRSPDNVKQVSHTWYSKCYNTKLNMTRPTVLLIGKGFEFDVDTINRLAFMLHPIKGIIIYD